MDFDVAVLATSERGYGLKQNIHIWISDNDFQNANLMILLAYIIMGHKEWANGHIKIFAVFPESIAEEESNRLFELIKAGQLPISSNNIRVIIRDPDTEMKTIIEQKSADADLTIVGLRNESIKHIGAECFDGLDNLGNTLYVSAAVKKEIK